MNQYIALQVSGNRNVFLAKNIPVFILIVYVFSLVGLELYIDHLCSLTLETIDDDIKHSLTGVQTRGN